ncbi:MULTISPECIES: heavy-metal-associated domain-containing protein [Cellulomonas]|uniref:Copper chaperone CopZ n=1 Tax=Cellulomonas marina TaxID=988821 RepID=A0A1I0YXL4_9CELL|nr:MULTISPECIES: heavy-metal-associated domain-containing protein [Cellulomonas]GIG28094.1 heavy metal transport/detoxification protein [Cellulomonas marina]SFB18084.1 Copper chaperone CopZ [Cellulomonas marina]
MSTATYAVTGMTCGHCVASVTEEVGKIGGVSAVDVDLIKGGISQVTVVSEAPVPESVVRTAVGEAGYEVVDATA